jgi:hypothetical protein
MHDFPHALPTVQTSQHFSRGMHAGGFGAGLGGSAADGVATKTAPATIAATRQ